MYNHKSNQTSASRITREQEDEKDESKLFIIVLQDVEVLFGEPIFFTSWFGKKLIQKLK